MGQDKKTPVTVNDVEYFYENMTDTQKAYVNHINDLDRKIGSAVFNLDQLRVGQQAFIDMLAKSLETVEEVKEAA
jgi:hypothetical protein